jgi:hypothetical protein
MPNSDGCSRSFRGVLIVVAHRHARRELEGAARLVNEATQAICEEIFFL